MKEGTGFYLCLFKYASNVLCGFSSTTGSKIGAESKQVWYETINVEFDCKFKDRRLLLLKSFKDIFRNRCDSRFY